MDPDKVKRARDRLRSVIAPALGQIRAAEQALDHLNGLGDRATGEAGVAAQLAAAEIALRTAAQLIPEETR